MRDTQALGHLPDQKTARSQLRNSARRAIGYPMVRLPLIRLQELQSSCRLSIWSVPSRLASLSPTLRDHVAYLKGAEGRLRPVAGA